MLTCRGLLALLLVASVCTGGCAPTVRIGSGFPLGPERPPELSTKLKSATSPDILTKSQRSLTDERKRAEQIEMISEVNRYFGNVMGECKVALSTYERRGEGLRYASLAISILGAIAGSIVVPALTAGGAAANAEAIAAFGGFSGVANTAQNTMTGLGLTAGEAFKVREEIRKQIDAAVEKYYQASDGGSIEARMLALDKLRVACVSYAISNPSVQVNTQEK
jgi:hypothetical protein